MGESKDFDTSFYDLRGHQAKALGKLENGKILWGGVGTGKSRVAAAYYHKNEAPKRVYVITTAKKRDSFDWQEEFYRLGIGPATGPVLESSGKGKGQGGRAGSEAELQRDLQLARKRRHQREQGSADGRSADDHVVRRPSDVGTTLQSNRDSERSGATDSAAGSVREGRSELGLERKDDHGRRAGDVGLAFAGNGSYPWVLIVDSWNNIAKYADVAGAFFIFDEQRLVGSGDWSRKFLRIAKHNNWILLSGTPGDTWMDYIPVFVANDFYKNRTAFKREHVVYNTFTKFPKVDRYIGVGKLLRLRAQLLVEMPYDRHTKRRIVDVPLKYDREALEMVLKKRWHIYENRPLRDVAEMFSVGRKLINSDPSRLEMVKELWQNHPKLIIFYNFNYELEILRSLTGDYSEVTKDKSSGRPQAEWPGSRSGKSLEEFGLRDFETLSIGTESSPLRTSTLTQDVPSSSMTKRSVRSAGTSTTTSQPTAMSTRVAERSGSKWASGTTSSTVESMPTGFERSTRSNSANTSVRTKTNTGTSNSKGSSRDTRSSPSFEIAEWNGHKHQPVPGTDRWLYLVQYTAGAEGWNCIETDAMIMYSRNYSWKVIEQAQGRIDRLNTPFTDLWYYDFTSDSFIDRAIGRSLKAKETFNEAKYARLFKG